MKVLTPLIIFLIGFGVILFFTLLLGEVWYVGMIVALFYLIHSGISFLTYKLLKRKLEGDVLAIMSMVIVPFVLWTIVFMIIMIYWASQLTSFFPRI